MTSDLGPTGNDPRMHWGGRIMGRNPFLFSFTVKVDGQLLRGFSGKDEEDEDSFLVLGGSEWRGPVCLCGRI